MAKNEKLVRLRNTTTGAVVQTKERTAANLNGFEPFDAASNDGPYAGLKVADLKAEITRRNEGREDADLLSLDGKKPDLIAVLATDDAAASE